MINVLQSSVYAVLIAMGLVFVIPQNEIDLSVGGNYVLTGIVAALFMRGGMTPALAIVLALSVSVLIGPLNALTSQIIGIPSLIGTLAMSWMLRGLELALSNGTQVTGVPLSDTIISVLGGGRLFGLPWPSAKACIRRSISANICSAGPVPSCKWTWRALVASRLGLRSRIWRKPSTCRSARIS